ncbi:MAG: hypothetical protein HY318_06750 [Armatimonadetes bacterium]|nr:hypothetical protein [Armatimonadota bacterium]
MAKQEQARQADEVQREAVLSALPPAVRAALELDGEELSNALGAALDDLPPEEARAVIRQLTAAGIIGVRTETMADITQLFDSLLPAVRAALEAHDEEAFKAAIAQLPPEEQQRIMAALEALSGEAEGEEE